MLTSFIQQFFFVIIFSFSIQGNNEFNYHDKLHYQWARERSSLPSYGRKITKTRGSVGGFFRDLYHRPAFFAEQTERKASLGKAGRAAGFVGGAIASGVQLLTAPLRAPMKIVDYFGKQIDSKKSLPTLLHKMRASPLGVFFAGHCPEFVTPNIYAINSNNDDVMLGLRDLPEERFRRNFPPSVPQDFAEKWNKGAVYY